MKTLVLLDEAIESSPTQPMWTTIPPTTRATTVPVQEDLTANQSEILPPVALTARQLIYTYQQTVRYEAAQWNTHLVRPWLSYWWSKGYKPVVLTQRDAEKHPQFQSYAGKFSEYPTVNHKLYELACYVRWVALAAVGGGIFMDYDMFAVRGSRDQLPKEIGESQLASDGRNMPMLTVAGPLGVGKILEALVADDIPIITVRGVPHTSDMIIIQAKRAMYSTLDPVVELAHFNHKTYTRFVKETNFTWLSRHRFVSELLLAHVLNTKRVLVLLPPKVTFSNHESCRFGCFPAFVRSYQEFLLGREVFNNLTSPLETFFPNMNPSVYCSLVFASEWPSDYSRDNLVFVAFSEQTVGRFSAPTALAVSQNIGEVFPLPIVKPVRTKLLLEYGTGARLERDPEFLVQDDGPPAEKGSNNLLKMLEARSEALITDILEVEKQMDDL